MSDSLPTVWPLTPHTSAKHKILRGYLSAWLPILSRQSKLIGSTREVLFVDGFAGPGVYEGGQDGSPIIALKAALDQAPFPYPIKFLFVERDKERVSRLKECLKTLAPRLQNRPDLRVGIPEKADCNDWLEGELDRAEALGKTFGPALVFLDQFGYSSVPMSLVTRVLGVPQCEVFTYLDTSHMNRFIEDKNKWPAITRAYGTEDWRSALDAPSRERIPVLLRTYRDALRERAKYVWYFSMFGEGNRPLYWLFFCTNSKKGLAEMKCAMWKVDDTGAFRFSDADDPGQMNLLSQIRKDSLDERLHSHFLGKEPPSVDEIEDFVLTQTAHYKYASSLIKLEKDNQIEVVNSPEGRRKSSFKEFGEMRVRFLPRQVSLFG